MLSSTMPPSKREHSPPGHSLEMMRSTSQLPTRQKLKAGPLETTLQGMLSSFFLETQMSHPLGTNIHG